MAWNEPNGNKDPWGRKPKSNSELDNALNDLNKYFKGLLGGTSGGSSSNKKNNSIIPRNKPLIIKKYDCRIISDTTIPIKSSSTDEHRLGRREIKGKISTRTKYWRLTA